MTANSDLLIADVDFSDQACDDGASGRYHIEGSSCAPAGGDSAQETYRPRAWGR